MKYIHSQESLTIPENGELNLFIYEYPKPEQSVGLNPSVRIRLHARVGFILRLLLTMCIVKIHIKSRVVTVEGPRGIRDQHDQAELGGWLMLGGVRQAYEEPGPSLCLLLTSFEKPRQYRTASWCPQERCYTPDCQNHHKQLDYRRDEGLQVQDAICLRPFSY